ncbi:MAG: hypothetical protein R6U58_00105 [Bacteroidales bacterium]
MAGQSPYVLNAGISYGNYDSGWIAGLFYNVKGPALLIAGIGLYPGIYVTPFHSLNFSINKKIGENQRTSIDFKASNILNSRTESYFESFNAGQQLYNSLNPGRSFSIGL